MKIKIQRDNPPSIYGHDDKWGEWSEFKLVGKNNSIPCHECGKLIRKGWVTGGFGEQQDYYCGKHIEVLPATEAPNPWNTGQAELDMVTDMRRAERYGVLEQMAFTDYITVTHKQQ